MENKKELCSCKKDKILNKKIRELFIEEIDKLGQIVFKNKGEDVVRYNCDRYNNKLKDGYNVVWKSSRMFMEEGIDVVWKNIVKRINEIDSGWEYKEFVNDGKVGMKKVYRDNV